MLSYFVKKTPGRAFQGGGAWARIDYSDVDPSKPYDGQANTTRSGWTVGGGFEYAFLPNWSAFVEYNYIQPWKS